MADQGRWFKLWVSSKDDPNLSVLPIGDFGRWCKLGTYLKVHGTEGVVTLTKPLDPLIIHPLQGGFQVATFDAVIDVISRFPNCDISSVTSGTAATVTYKIEWRNWLKYQGDFSGDRVRKHRTKKADAVTAKKRREEKRKEEKKNTLPPLPDWLPADAWNGYLEMRSKIKKPLTERARDLAITKLETLKQQGEDLAAVLDQSTYHNWQGLFAVKHSDWAKPGPPPNDDFFVPFPVTEQARS